MATIQEMIRDYINESNPPLARMDIQLGKPGVTFLDENEFIPFDDLGYNQNLGFYQLSLFPDAKNEAD